MFTTQVTTRLKTTAATTATRLSLTWSISTGPK